MSKRYLERGVSSQKEDVHKAIKNQDKGLFENTFLKVITYKMIDPKENYFFDF